MEEQEIDPISGNEVPPGSEPEEVRDDVDAKLSEGEYVVPADVVRYLGLDKLEKLVSKAKEDLAQMHEDGRIGGKPLEEEDDLPFTDEELLGDSEAPVQMATGGLVTKPPALDNLPDWLKDTVTPVPSQSLLDRGDTQADRKSGEIAKGIADSIDNWSAKDFSTALTQRTSPGAAMAQKVATMGIPFGGQILNLRDRYVDKNVTAAIDKMLADGVDKNGQPLSEKQVADLKAARQGFVETAGYKTTSGSLAGDLLGGLFSKKDSQKETSVQKGSGSNGGSSSGEGSSRAVAKDKDPSRR